MNAKSTKKQPRPGPLVMSDDDWELIEHRIWKRVEIRLWAIVIAMVTIASGLGYFGLDSWIHAHSEQTFRKELEDFKQTREGYEKMMDERAQGWFLETALQELLQKDMQQYFVGLGRLRATNDDLIEKLDQLPVIKPFFTMYPDPADPAQFAATMAPFQNAPNGSEGQQMNNIAEQLNMQLIHITSLRNALTTFRHNLLKETKVDSQGLEIMYRKTIYPEYVKNMRDLGFPTNISITNLHDDDIAILSPMLVRNLPWATEGDVKPRPVMDTRSLEN